MDARATVVADLYRGARDRDWGSLERLFADDIELGVSGRSPIAGTYRGRETAIAAIRRLFEETSIAPVREDTWDVCASDYHVVLIEWLQAERNGHRARFYIHLICAMEDREIKRAFASFDSQYEFDELWS